MKKTTPSTSEIQAVGEGYDHAAAVTPNDSGAVAYDGLWIGTAGNIKVDMAGGESGITFNSVPAGLLKIRVTRVYSTGTTASNIVGLNF